MNSYQQIQKFYQNLFLLGFWRFQKIYQNLLGSNSGELGGIIAERSLADKNWGDGVRRSAIRDP